MENQITKTQTGLAEQKISATLGQRLERYRLIKADSFIEVLNAKSKSLKKISELYGRDELKIFLADIIAELSQFLNVGKNMTASQCLTTSELLITRYPEIHLEDIKLCITNGKSGEYGKAYDRLDGQVILDWFDKYSIQKLEFIENRHEQLKQDQPDIFNSGNEKFMEIFKNLTIEPKPTTPKEYSPEFQEASLLANSWMKDFDSIHLTQYKGVNQSIRFITIEDKNYDISEYLNYRLKTHLGA